MNRPDGLESALRRDRTIVLMALSSVPEFVIGVLLHFKLKTGPLATAGLMLIMIGAMYTHRHNNDPFSDSYAALSQFMTLGIMLILFYFEREVNFRGAQQEKTAHATAVFMP